MATNYFGSCKGTEGSKYDIWLNVTQNSQNISGNKSNVTVKLYLKRNDNTPLSAYSTSTSNSVKLYVGGVLKASSNPVIDTRYSVGVLLASWTGDVSHAADGTLSLSVSGSFTIAGVSTLTGGSASGSFKCTTISRKSSFTLSASSVNPGGNITTSITVLNSNFTHKINFQIGEVSKTLTLDKTMNSVNFTVPQEWANQITVAKSGVITVTLTTYNGSSSLGSVSSNLTLKIPNTTEYKPTFSVVLTRINNDVPSVWETYIRGRSQVKVSVNNISTKYMATYSGCVIKVGDVSLSGKENTFDLPKAGEISIVVTVKDSRGYETTSTQTITVLNYTPPSIKVTNLRRCNEDGELDAYGTSLYAEYTTTYSSINNKNTCRIYVKYQVGNSSNYSTAEEVENGSNVVLKNAISVSSTHTVAFYVVDELAGKSPEVYRYIPTSSIPFNIKKGGNGAAFGKFSKTENELSVGWGLTVDKLLTAKSGIKGDIYFEDVPFAETDNSYNLVGGMKCYNGLSIVHVDIRFTTKTEITANKKTYVIEAKESLPSRFVPLECFCLESDTFCKCGIYNASGGIYIWTNKNIPAGKFVYINGFYLKG